MSERDGVRPHFQPGAMEQAAAGEAAPARSLAFAPPAVAGPEMARRLAEDTAALAEAESGPGDDPALLVGEEEREPALGFYLLLVAMVAAVLAVVIGYSSSRRPVDTGAVQGALRAHLAPAGPADRSPGLLVPRPSPPARFEPASPNPAARPRMPPPPADTRAPTGQSGITTSPASPFGTGATEQQAAPDQSLVPRARRQVAEPSSGYGSVGRSRFSPEGGSSSHLPPPSLQLHVPPLLQPADPGSALPTVPPSGPAGRLRLPNQPLTRNAAPFGIGSSR